MSESANAQLESRRRLLLGGAAVPAVALGLSAFRSGPVAAAADLDYAVEARTISEIRAANTTPPVPGYVITDPGREGVVLLDP